MSAHQHRDITDTIPGSGSVVLSGASGYGKTQIAAGYFVDNNADLRLWVSATTSDGVLAGYARAAAALELADEDEGVDRLASRFLSWLAGTHKTWLVVLDNLDDPGQLTPTPDFPSGLWPPIRQNGLTITTTTSRDPQLRDGGRTRIDIDPYTSTEAIAYLNERLTPARNTEELPAEALDQAEKLADDLAGHPLALAQAAAFILADALTIQDYRTLLARQRLEQALPERARADGYTGTVHATYTVAVNQANSHTRGLAQPLLLYLAVLDPTAAPDTLTTTTPLTHYLTPGDTSTGETDRAGEVQDPVGANEVRTALRVLHRLSLTTHLPGRATRALRTHPLVARITRERATSDQLVAAVRAAADSLVDVWPEIENDTAMAAVLRANAGTISGHDAANHSLWNQELHSLLFRHGRSLGEAGLLQPAITYFTALIQDSTQILGSDHPHTLTARHFLASWRGQAGNPSGAASALGQLLTDRLRVIGADHPDTLNTRHNLAYWRGQAGDPAGAATAFEVLLADLLQVLGPDHLDTLVCRHNLAYWRGQAGDPAAAATAFEELLADRLRILGPDHPHTLLARHNVAYWRGQAGDPAGAATATNELFLDSLRVLGADHPSTLATRSNLAYWRGQAGDPTGAATLFEELLADSLRVLSVDHPSTLATRRDFAHWQGKSGNPVSAVSLFERLLPDYLRVLGADHPGTLTTRALLATWHGQAGDPAKAATLFEELLADRLRVLGADHPDTRSTRHDLAHWRGQASGHAS